MAGKLFAVDPMGTYLLTNKDPRAKAATTINLASIGASPGDYLALEEVGSYHHSGPNSPTARAMIGCFFGDKIRRSPGPFGQDFPVITSPTYYDNLPTDIPEDFYVPDDRKIIVRVPEGATQLKICPHDTHFGDNVRIDYGIKISFPNKPKPTPRALDNAASVENGILPLIDDEAGIEEIIDKLAPAKLPIATSFLPSPFSTTTSQATLPQWRGWYNPDAWLPHWSHYDAKRRNNPKRHGGWDIFAPNGSSLLAVVGPAKLVFLSPPNAGPDFGTLAVMRFRHGQNDYAIVFGHVSAFVGQPRIVNAGEIVANAGCAGNSAKEACGKEMASGGYSDHVHVGLYKHRDTINPTTKIDPSELLKWTIETPT